jgi:hypothetical protein
MSLDEHPGAPPPAEGSGRAFWIAVSLVTVSSWVPSAGRRRLLGGGHDQQRRRLPRAASSSFAMPATCRALPLRGGASDVYSEVPCFCGCDATLDHRFLLDCFVRPDGRWEAHASGCGVCLEEGRMIRSMLAGGSATAEIRAEVIDAFTMNGM